MSKHDNDKGVDQGWRVELDLTKDGDESVATAELFVGELNYEAHGHARSAPFSSGVAEELAVARALSNLAHQLVDSASREVDTAARAVSVAAQEAKEVAGELSG